MARPPELVPNSRYNYNYNYNQPLLFITKKYLIFLGGGGCGRVSSQIRVLWGLFKFDRVCLSLWRGLLGFNIVGKVCPGLLGFGAVLYGFLGLWFVWSLLGFARVCLGLLGFARFYWGFSVFCGVQGFWAN